ncbi:MAG: YqhA family protein [Pseudomonadota bacterium]
MIAQFERLLFVFRFALAPMALGLSVGIILVLYKFLEQIFEILVELTKGRAFSDAEFLIDVLSLVDFFLIAGLLTMVMIAGYENFVTRTDLGRGPRMPSWIGRLSHHDLKLNLSLTIVAISMFLLLQVFLTMVEEGTEVPAQTFEVLPWMIGLHVTFVFSALVLAIINRLNSRADAE